MRRVIIFAVLTTLAIVPVAAANTLTWTGASSNLWSDPGNWGGVAPSKGDDLVFPAGAANLTNVSDLDEFDFNSLRYEGGAYAVYGNAIVLGPGGVTVTGGSLNFVIDVMLGAPQTWSFAASASVLIDGRIDLNLEKLTIDNATTARMVETIKGLLPPGQVGIEVRGNGELHVSAQNTFRAGMELTGGRLVADTDVGIPATCFLSIADGATFDLAGHTVTLDGLIGTGNVALSGGQLILTTNQNGSNVTGATGATFSGPGSIVSRGQLAEFGEASASSDVTLDVVTEVSFSPTHNPTAAFDAGIVLGGPAANLWLRNGARVGSVTATSGNVIVGASPELGDPISAEASVRDLTLGGGAFFIAGAQPPAYGRGVLHVNGAVSLGNRPLLIFDYPNALSNGPVNAQRPSPDAAPITIIDNDGADPIGGMFERLSEGSRDQWWRISYRGGDGNDVTLTPAAIATLALASSKNPSTAGEGVTFTATVISPSGGTAPTGYITFGFSPPISTPNGNLNYVDVPLDSTGSASYSTPDLGVGDDGVQAAYSGDATYPGTSISIVQHVKVGTSTTLITSINPAAEGAAVVFTATVAATNGSTPSGNVTFFDGSTTLQTVPLDAAHVAAYTTSALVAGAHSIAAHYNGDATHTPSISAPLAQTISTAMMLSTTALVTSKNPSASGERVTLVVAVEGLPGAPMPTGIVVLIENGIQFATLTLDATGHVTMSWPFPVGTQAITAVYGGDANYSGSAAVVFQTVLPGSTRRRAANH